MRSVDSYDNGRRDVVKSIDSSLRRNGGLEGAPNKHSARVSERNCSVDLGLY